MNLLEVGIKLKPENIQSFIDDFLKVDGVSISNIELRDGMILINKIKYKSFGTICVGFQIERVENGIVSLAIRKLKTIGIPISVVTVNFILKIVLSKVNMVGISFDGKKLNIDLSVIFKEFDLNFLALDIKDIQITDESINVVVNNINLNFEELMSKSKKQNEKNEALNVKLGTDNCVNKNLEFIPVSNEDSSFRGNEETNSYRTTIDEEYLNKPKFTRESKMYFSEYSRVRQNLYSKKFEKFDKSFLGKVVFLIPDIAVLCYRLLFDKRVKKGVKSLLIFMIVYLINPMNIFKEKHIFNRIEGSLLLVFTLNKIFCSIDTNVIRDHFEGSEDTLNFLIDAFGVLDQFFIEQRVNNLYTIFEKFVK